MKATIIASFAMSAAAVSAAGNYSTSTVYATSVYTITSCAPTVTDCPSRMGSVTTEVISLYTTLCPVAKTLPLPTSDSTSVTKDAPFSTSTIRKTVEYTITSCPPYVVNCPVGSKTSTVITSTTVLPHETASIVSPAAKPTSTVVVAPLVSVLTISTCMPTVYTSVITVYPSGSASVSHPPAATNSVTAAACPGGANCPAAASVTTVKSYGTAVPTAPGKNGTATPSYIPVTGAAASAKAGILLIALGAAAAALL